MTAPHRSFPGAAPPRFRTWHETIEFIRGDPAHADLVRDAYYDDPLPAAAERYRASAEWQSIRVLLPRTRGRALDVGAGRGIASYALAREGFEVTALEPDPSALVGAQAIRALAQAAGLAITVVQEFSERLPFADGAFGLVFARAVLHHTSNLGAACREFARVLAPGGQLVAVREHVISRRADLPAFFAKHPLHRLYGGENAFLASEYVQALQAAGLRLAHVLAPFDSPINFAPQTRESLGAEIAGRIGRRLPGAGRLIGSALATETGWRIARAALNRLDHRPGRLYSFVADRP